MSYNDFRISVEGASHRLTLPCKNCGKKGYPYCSECYSLLQIWMNQARCRVTQMILAGSDRLSGLCDLRVRF